MACFSWQHVLCIIIIGLNLLERSKAKPTIYIDLADNTLDDIEHSAVRHAVMKANTNYSFVLKVWNVTGTADVCNYTSSLLQRDVVAIFGQQNSSLPVCAIGTIVKLPTVKFRVSTYDEYQAPLCEGGLSLTSGYDSYSRAVVDLLKTFHLKSVAVMFQSGRFYEAAYLQSAVQSETDLVLKYIRIEKDSNETSQQTANRAIDDIRLLGSVDAVVVFADDQLIQALLKVEHYDPRKSLLWILESAFLQTIQNLNAAASIKVVMFRMSRNERSSVSELMSYMRQQTGNTGVRFESLKETAVLVHDAILVISQVLNNVIKDNKWIWRNTTGLTASNSETVLEYAKKIQFTGLSGTVRFDVTGQRKVEAFDVLNLNNDSFVKIGTWNTSRKIIVTAGLKTNKQSSSSFGSIEGRHLRIVTVPLPPFVFKRKTESGTVFYEGFCIDLLNKLAEELRFTYEIYDSPDGNFGAEINGKWNGMIREVMDKKADMAVSGTTASLERSKVVKFTISYMFFTEDMLLKKSTNKELNFLQFMDPFEIEVWLMVLVCLFVVTVGTFVLNYYSPYGFKDENDKGTSEEFSWFNSLWFSLACMLQQGGDNTPKCLSGRILAGCYWFCILVWVSTYTANLAAFFTVKNSKTPINSLEDAANSADYQISVLHSSSTYSYFRSAEYELHSRIWHKMQANKAFPNSLETAVEWVRTKENYIFIIDAPYLKYISKKKPCDLFVVPGLTAARGLGFALNLNEPAAENISIAMLRLREAGFMSSLERKWWDGRSECLESAVDQLNNKKIKFTSMLGVYIVLAVGTVLGFVTLGVEIWWFRKGRETYKSFRERYKGRKETKVKPFEEAAEMNEKDF